jgi:hypothetical protein
MVGCGRAGRALRILSGLCPKLLHCELSARSGWLALVYVDDFEGCFIRG